MKARNNFERRVVDINATLRQDIAQSTIEWAKDASKDWNIGSYCYFTVHSNMREFMVRRLYRMYKYSDKSHDQYFFVEIMREFNDGHQKAYCSKVRVGLGAASFDTFSFDGEIVLRGFSANYYYDIRDLFNYAMDSVSEDNASERVACSRMNPKYLWRVIKDNPVGENLYKNNDPLFYRLLGASYVKETCRAITIAKRHGFVFDKKTTPIWFDLVYAIIYCKKDWHNPVYIAPADLQATHDRFMNMLQRKKRENELARAYRKVQNETKRNKSINEKYVERRKRFYDMVITDGLIECRVLRDVEEFLEEAEAMQHCVYKCRYFERPYSLILSARIGGSRIETVEVDLTNYTISQSFGKHDTFSMYHKRIVNLVNSQMDTIKRYSRKRSTSKMKIAV